MRRIVHPGSDTGSRLDVAHGGATSATRLNCATGQTGRVLLGTCAPRPRGNGKARAGAVEFVRAE